MKRPLKARWPVRRTQCPARARRLPHDPYALAELRREMALVTSPVFLEPEEELFEEEEVRPSDHYDYGPTNTTSTSTDTEVYVVRYTSGGIWIQTTTVESDCTWGSTAAGW